MNIVLIGMRGSGKTTVGRLLSEKTGFKFVECDKLLEQSAGETIPEFVAKDGWPKFRDLESKIINDVSENDNTIISTGGGVVEKQENINNLKRNGLLIWLHAEVEILYARIRKNRNRPLLTSAKFMRGDLKAVFKKRKTLYAESADQIIDVSNKGIAQIADEIIIYLKKEGKL